MLFPAAAVGLASLLINAGLPPASSLRPTQARGLTCPRGNWTLFGESCYNFRHETYNWFDAKTVCQEIGARLTEVETVEEQLFLLTAINNTFSLTQHVWLGLQDFLEEGQWVWTSSQQPATPSFWNPGEPEDRMGEEDCGGMVGGGWFDTNCEDDASCTFICEAEAQEV